MPVRHHELHVISGPISPQSPRIAAFALLMLYHVGTVFVTWVDHVKTAHPPDALESAMALLNPQRLSLLLVVSGAATRFMAARITPCALAS